MNFKGVDELFVVFNMDDNHLKERERSLFNLAQMTLYLASYTNIKFDVYAPLIKSLNALSDFFLKVEFSPITVTKFLFMNF